MDKFKLDIEKIRDSAVLPFFSTPGSAGMDLVTDYDFTLEKLKPIVIKLGFKMRMPIGYEAQIRSKSGMTLKGVIVANSPGTIDSDYRDEVGVILMSLNDEIHIKAGTKIAQMVVASYGLPEFKECEINDITERKGGFGSTGTCIM